VETTPEAVAEELRLSYERGKPHAIAVVAEGARYNAEALAAYFRIHQERIGFELRTTTLGHVQRGGAPTAYDRLLGTRFGGAAVEALADGQRGVLVGLIQNRVTTTPLAEVVGRPKPLDPELLTLAKILKQ
jgi:6-phosphofructokinase 1